MGYFNIIDSLVDNRSDINEGGLLRDNKQLLQNIKRRTELSNICSMVSHGMGFSFTLKVDDYAVTTNRMTLYFNISDDAYTWVESKGSAFLCLDLRKVLSYSNIKYFENDIKLQFKDFNKYTSAVANDFVREVLYMGGVADDSYVVNMLQHCGIGGVNVGNLQDYIKDTNTYNIVLEVVLDELRTFLMDIIYDNLNTDNLYGTVSSIKGLVLIDNRYVAVLGVYLSSGVNEVVVPLQKELEKCDIISGKVCQVDTVTNYINKRWFLPSPINIDKKFNYIKNRSYFIVMNTR